MADDEEKLSRRKSVAVVASTDWLKIIPIALSTVALMASLIVIPLAGWVWSTNSRVVTLELSYSGMAKDVDKIESETNKIDVIQNDIESIKSDIGEIKEAVQ